jgi:hypothetical protein
VGATLGGPHMEWPVLEFVIFDEAREATAPLELSGEAQEPACPDNARKAPTNLEQSAEAQALAQPALEMLNIGSHHGDAHVNMTQGASPGPLVLGAFPSSPGGFV